MDATKPYRFIGFGVMDATKPYRFIGFGFLFLFFVFVVLFVAVRPLGKMAICVLICCCFGSVEVGPRTPLNGPGSKNGAERKPRKRIISSFRGQFLVQAKN